MHIYSLKSAFWNKPAEVCVYGHWGVPILLFPTTLGDIRQYENFGLIDTVSDLLINGSIKIYVASSADAHHLYKKNLSPAQKISSYQLYSNYLSEELIPHIQHECQTDRIGIGGASFGAYHASNYTFKHPNDISFLINMSGTFNIDRLMADFHNEDVYFNSPFQFIPGAEIWPFNHLKIILGTADQDICLAENKAFDHLLTQHQINHTLDIQINETHDWPLWNKVFRKYLESVLY